MGVVVTYNLHPTEQDKTFGRYSCPLYDNSSGQARGGWDGWICREHQVSFRDGVHELALSLHLQSHRS